MHTGKQFKLGIVIVATCLIVSAGQAVHADEASEVRALNSDALLRAYQDLAHDFGDTYTNAAPDLPTLLRGDLAGLADRAASGDAAALDEARALITACRNAMLANPLLNFDRLLLVKRGADKLGLPQNWESNSSISPKGYDNALCVLSPVRPDGTLTPLITPEDGAFIGDVDLDFDASRLVFSMPESSGRWRIWECGIDGMNPQLLPLINELDVDNYDACYLPDGNLMFTSTAPFTGVPCVTGSAHVSNLYLLTRATGNIRRLTVEQDHDWCPTVLNDGRVLYLRWEYSDIPHFVSRILFQMNPDGTGQMEYYGSNSYWPNAMFYARPIPGSPSKFVAIVGGHHDAPRMGELVLFDRAKGRFEADGAIQRIPGYGKKVEPILLDGLVLNSWPKCLHPYPLSEKYFLVSARLSPDSGWGLYLADVFDNMTLLHQCDGAALLEPIPLRPTPRPPVIPDKVKLDRKDALIYLADIYAGKGLDGMPRGTVKQLRLYTYQFAYYGMGGQVNRVGLDGPWDVKRIIGTVPVEPDGSALFRVPANMPIAIQPLDSEGRALQVMRSWMTAMPGETLSCVGCHEQQSSSAPHAATLAGRHEPSEITPWHGPLRGFSFDREVQPVLNANCIRCHNGQPPLDGEPIPDFTERPMVHPEGNDPGYSTGSIFRPAYLALRRYVRAPTIESDMHLLPPGEFHPDTAELVQTLQKGHHDVQLTQEAWDRLYTWMDLAAPAHGTWREIVGDQKVLHWRDRRQALLEKYAGLQDDPEAIIPSEVGALTSSATPSSSPSSAATPASCDGFPFDAAEALRRQTAGTAPIDRVIDLGNGVTLSLRRIPAGDFIMGDASSTPDEQPASAIHIDAPFWMGTFEITNAQFARFDPAHDSRLEHGDFLQFSIVERGFPLNAPDQPVTRVSWNNALAFCRWLSEQTGEAFTLPTEAQWEYACRAGSRDPFWYGGLSADFTPYANLADASLAKIDTYPPWQLPSGALAPWRPAIMNLNDGYRVSAPVGHYAPNPWGLYDMHGNVAEWTRSEYRPYPYVSSDGRDDPAGTGKKVARGGSWYDRPKCAGASFRWGYAPYLPVYDIGFRVVCPAS